MDIKEDQDDNQSTEQSVEQAAEQATEGAPENLEAKPAEFVPLEKDKKEPNQVSANKGDRLTQLMKVDVEANVCLGATQMKLSDAMALEPGAVVTLDHEVGQPVELFVNQRLFARGEVVVIGDRFGLRVTQLLGD